MGYYDDEQPILSDKTLEIPCSSIKLADFIILQGRPCQVIKISTSTTTGIPIYRGVDAVTGQFYEASPSQSSPSTMLGPKFKLYKLLDIHDGCITAMTETGNVKQGLNPMKASGVFQRCQTALEKDCPQVMLHVLNDGGSELVVDVKELD
ncbi:unnamed protein product [Penicillium salamii]|uniref:Translation initiation factor 5A-like N-terminal domain-containing protein n=1 Tax=Penicillium salamii TaxID=1612424 RepID=A0A9W4JCZ3_9EURO|nr:unnamed protein product [Penicillium salamii]CAG7947224.1 unnamed protein product [Penicillium salamii]CAG7947702.1 unnamed protein product [Penicillium salamii]CAG8081989.1 unnamed protein product [Penicillium salamii]CAG8120200.1 unnamed protein product [Penicillium salamii]